MPTMIEYDPINSDYIAYISVEKIVRINKEGGNTTIHLSTGERISTETSMNTLVARINSTERKTNG